MKAKIQLALVSDQAVPNLTPLLDPDFQPEELILLVSPDKARQAGWLEEVVRPRGIKVSEWPIENAWDIEHVKARVWELLEARDGEDIALNATGGTKPMSIAAYEVFRDWQKPIFYVHPQEDRVIWMHPSNRAGLKLADRVRLESFLQAYGTRVETVERSRVEDARAELASDLVGNLAYYGWALRVLNWIANSAQGGRLSSTETLTDDQLDRNSLLDLLDRFEGIGLLTREDRALRFPDESARFFVNGGWLEEYVFDSVRELRKQIPAIQDVARSLNVLREGPRGQVRNELDVALLADNRLYLIECKTRGWSSRGRPQESSPGSEALYKLDTIRDVMGGLQGRAMLVSYQRVAGHDRTRAEDLRIKVCAGSQVQQFKRMLSDWIQSATE